MAIPLMRVASTSGNPAARETCRVQVLGFRVHCSLFRVQGLCLRVPYTHATPQLREGTHSSHLTGCIYELVLEGQLPYKVVNLLFTITDQNVKLTVL